MIAAIVAAAGSGERFGAPIPKALIQLGDRTLLEHAVSSLSAVVDQIVVTAPAGFEDQIRALVGDAVTVVTGGATRSDSVRAGLAAIDNADFVLVHDAARALATRELAASVVAALKAGDVAVVPTLPVVDSAGLDRVFSVLRQPYTEEPTNWSRRYKANLEKLASGDVIKVAEVVRDLYRRDLDRGLSAGEKRMLAKAKQILVSELALAERTDEEKAATLLDEVLAS
jgi:RNA polymerase-interacting CarD/CdnL/TRCF family regulator